MASFLDKIGLADVLTRIKNAFVAKADTQEVQFLDIDSTPTANSTNLVTSGGVAGALAGKQDTIVDLANIRSGSQDNVKYTQQTLTDAQKSQARSNIGVEDSVLVSSLTDYPEPYNLSNPKTLAQTATAFGVSESEIIALSEGKYSQIKFGDNILGIDSIKVTEGLDPGEPWTIVYFGTTVGQSTLTSTKALVFIWDNAERTSAMTLMQSVENENITYKCTS